MVQWPIERSNSRVSDRTEPINETILAASGPNKVVVNMDATKKSALNRESRSNPVLNR